MLQQPNIPSEIFYEVEDINIGIVKQDQLDFIEPSKWITKGRIEDLFFEKTLNKEAKDCKPQNK